MGCDHPAIESNRLVVAIRSVSLLELSRPLNMAEVARPISLASFGFIRMRARVSISSKRMISFSGWGVPFGSWKTASKFFEKGNC